METKLDWKVMLLFILALTAYCLLPVLAFAQEPLAFSTRTETFVGPYQACGKDYPPGRNIVSANWASGQGLNDGEKNEDTALYLEKNGVSTDCSSAQLIINPSVQSSINEIGFDYRSDGQCTATSPVFIITTSDGQHRVQGCDSSKIPSALVDGQKHPWQRVRFNLNDPIHVIPPLPPFTKVAKIVLQLDEGTDKGPGFIYIDNIDINGNLIPSPEVSTSYKGVLLSSRI